MSDEIRGYHPIQPEPLTYHERAQYGATDGNEEPRHFEDPDQRRAIKALAILDEWFPRTIEKLPDSRYIALEKQLRRAFRRITREEAEEQARRRNRTVRDCG